MARFSSKDVGFLLSGGRDLLGTTTELDFNREVLTEMTLALGDADESHTSLGIKAAELTQEGFYDDAADSSNDALVGLIETVFNFGLEGNTAGKQFVGLDGALETVYNRLLSREALTRANASYKSDGKVEDGKIVKTHTQVTTAGPASTASVDNSASSANGGAGYLQVSQLALGGYTDVTIKLRDSTDDIAFADLITFANVSAAPAAERKTVAGTINQFVEAEHEFNGSGSGQSITFFAGLVRD